MNLKTEAQTNMGSIKKYVSEMVSFVKKYIGSAEEIIENIEWIVLMLFMLNWNKRFSIIESILGISYVYTYKNEGLKDISYKIEGYLILITLIVKLLRQSYHIYK